MKMDVENKLDKVVNILKEKGFVVYRKGGKEPGVFYAKEGDSRIGFVYPNNGYIYDRIKMWSFSRVYKPHKKTGSSCLMYVSHLIFYKSLHEIKKVNPLYAFKVATAYFREKGMIPVFEDAICKLIKP